MSIKNAPKDKPKIEYVVFNAENVEIDRTETRSWPRLFAKNETATCVEFHANGYVVGSIHKSDIDKDYLEGLTKAGLISCHLNVTR